MRSESREVFAPDGRRLTVWVDGEEEEFILCHSGSPEDGSTGLYRPRSEAAAERGFTLVGYSRPGYRYSDRHPGRRVVDCVEDVSAIADALGIDSFVTVGWSGGGPHALACAARMPGRVRAVATVGSNAPRGADGLDWYEGMGEENLAEFGAAEKGSAALRRFLESEATKWRAAGPEDVLTLFAGLLPDDARGKFSTQQLEIATVAMRNALETGIWGWFDDDMATVSDWGFDPAEIEVPVAIWHGGEEDRFIPPSHGEWLAGAIPRATPYFRPTADHLTVASNVGEIFDSLASGV